MLIDLADASEIKAISECILNVLNGHIKLKSEQKKKLKRHKDTLRHLASRSNSTHRKRALLHQRGGFLSALLPLALSAVGSIIPGLLGTKQ